MTKPDRIVSDEVLEEMYRMHLRPLTFRSPPCPRVRPHPLKRLYWRLRGWCWRAGIAWAVLRGTHRCDDE